MRRPLNFRSRLTVRRVVFRRLFHRGFPGTPRIYWYLPVRKLATLHHRARVSYPPAQIPEQPRGHGRSLVRLGAGQRQQTCARPRRHAAPLAMVVPQGRGKVRRPSALDEHRELTRGFLAAARTCRNYTATRCVGMPAS